MKEDNLERIPEKVKTSGVNKEKGYLYYIDEDGDISRVPAKWNKDPKFLEKVEEDEKIVDEKFKEMNINYAEQENDHEKPIPVTSKNIPAYFKNKNIIYSDKGVVVTIGDKAVSKNQICVYSKNKSNYQEIDDDFFTHILTVSSFASSIAYEGLKAQGTNIILNEFEELLRSNVIPRHEKDGLNLLWEMKQGNPESIKKNAQKIKDCLFIGEKQNFNKVNLDKKTNIIDNEKLQEDIKELKTKKNYMIDHLRRTD